MLDDQNQKAADECRKCAKVPMINGSGVVECGKDPCPFSMSPMQRAEYYRRNNLLPLSDSAQEPLFI